MGRMIYLVAAAFLLYLLGQVCFMNINLHAPLVCINWHFQASAGEHRPQTSNLVLQFSLNLIRKSIASNGSS